MSLPLVNFFAFTQAEARTYAQAFDLEQTVEKLLLRQCICDEPPEARKGFKCPVHQPDPDGDSHGR